MVRRMQSPAYRSNYMYIASLRARFARALPLTGMSHVDHDLMARSAVHKLSIPTFGPQNTDCKTGKVVEDRVR